MKHSYEMPSKLRWQKLVFERTKSKSLLRWMVPLLLLGISFTSKGQTTELTYSGNIQTYTVPAGVTRISIETFGAQGGNNGGLGARMKGEFDVQPGQILKVLVGQQGTSNYAGNMNLHHGSSGGGGTFVATADNIPLVVSGGGGGNVGSPNGNINASISTSGFNGNSTSNPNSYGVGGTAGNGAKNSPTGNPHAGNGGGFFTAGQSGSCGGPGQAFITGGAGGTGCSALGGFGGGGAGGNAGGGGGGGYSGGGGSYHYPGNGGGGGSFNAGTNQNNLAGVNTGNGKAIITVLSATYYQDSDNDSFGNSAISVMALTPPVGYILRGGDCNDNDPTINPGATDLCDGIDRNCDGLVLTRPTGVLSGGNTTCAGQATTLTFALTGTAPWSITYTDGTTPVTVNGILTSPYTVSVNPTTTTTYSLTAVSDALCVATSFTGSAEVTVNASASIIAPANIVTTTDQGRAGATVSFEATATGTPTPTISYSINGVAITSPYFFRAGVTTVTATATNSCNEDTKTFTVTVNDNEAPVPVLASLPVISRECSATVTAPTANDNAAGTITATTNDPVVYSEQGTYTITWTYNDGNGNTATQTQTVELKDVTRPVFANVDPVTRNNDLNVCGATVTYTTPSVSDNCGNPTVTQTAGLPSGSLFPLGTTTNTFVATDAAGNTSTTSFDVTVTDTQKPTVIIQNITVQLDANGAATITPVQINNGSTDNCSISENGYSLDKTSFDCANVGANTVTLTVTDVNGNTESRTAIVTVEDKTAPIAVAKNITAQLAANGEAVITPEMVNDGSSDLCGQPVTLALSKTTFTCSNLGENTVTLTVTDASGNTHTATATVTVEDKVAPVAIAKNITVQLDAAGNANITAEQVNNNSTDNCGIASIAIDKNSFTCANVGANTVTLTVTDNSGNTHTATATVTVEDKVAPVAIAKNITVQLNAAGTVTIAAADVNDNSTDNCGVASLALSKTAFDCANVGANTVTLTVTDVHGNVSTATATVTVEDNINPTITAPAAVTVTVDPGKTTASNVALGTPVTADNCSVATATNNAPATYPTGNTTVTWTVTDASGNTATATQIVTVKPNAVSAARPATLEVPIRTTFANVNKPATVAVTFTDGNAVQVPVTWQQGTYNRLESGDYEITGTLTMPADRSNVNNVDVKWTVRVMPNQAPTNITLSKSSFQPSIGPDQAIGTLTTTDVDDPIDNQPENQHLYELVTGAGSTDNALFEIDGNQLFLKSNKGLSGKTSFSIRVRTVDPYNNTFEKTFTLTKEGYNVATVDLKIVNAFSPNGDGVNDTWTVPELKFYNNVEVQVFDRSGVRLFHTTNPEQGWNGRNQHNDVLAGPYLYIIHVKDINYVKKGTVTILKK